MTTHASVKFHVKRIARIRAKRKAADQHLPRPARQGFPQLEDDVSPREY